MGQEFAAEASWFFFADHNPELAKTVLKGRREFLAQFPSYATPESQDAIPDPSHRSTFEQCKLDWSERDRHKQEYALHQDLIRLRREDAVIARQSRADVDGAVFSREVFVLRFFGGEAGDRLLIINLGPQYELPALSEPLLAAGSDDSWHLVWSSDAPRYGGAGAIDPRQNGKWVLSGFSATFFSSQTGAHGLGE
jgi:maltooligosyltrehalose trehalohydrolase